jgi:hypothetical protein
MPVRSTQKFTVERWEPHAVFASIIITIVFASITYYKNPLLSAIFVGALGGVVHEIAQSNGRLMFPQTTSDGVYLGGLFGLLAGGIAGLILVQGVSGLASPSLLSEAFLAGLSLKGFSEAVAGTNKPTMKK